RDPTPIDNIDPPMARLPDEDGGKYRPPGGPGTGDGPGGIDVPKPGTDGPDLGGPGPGGIDAPDVGGAGGGGGGIGAGGGGLGGGGIGGGGGAGVGGAGAGEGQVEEVELSVAVGDLRDEATRWDEVKQAFTNPVTKVGQADFDTEDGHGKLVGEMLPAYRELVSSMKTWGDRGLTEFDSIAETLRTAATNYDDTEAENEGQANNSTNA
ncbi:MAG TPA: hypothetical protein IAA98_06175, partial [Candidatus Avipropionibacterium avicola]|nr:hypothetical protein [Candidatus Avipropionibacterium avicola]